MGFANQDEPEWAYARVQESEQGRLVVTELYLARERMDSVALRSLPLGRIETLANSSPYSKDIRAKLNDPPRPGREPMGGERRPRWKSRKTISPTPHLVHLAVPEGMKPDRFYKEAAELYADRTERSGVAVASVHRWIAEARRRGYLPPAERGRRG